MSMRVTEGVERGSPVRLTVDGRPVIAFTGETVAVALLAAGVRAFRRDQAGAGRGPYCNMGVCYECLVEIDPDDGGPSSRLRACMTLVADAMFVRTDDA